MSMQDRVGAICPNCGRATESKIWGTVNVGINPELREEVLTGTVRRTTCPFCSAEFNVEWHLLFHAFRGREHIMDSWCPLDLYRALEQEAVEKFGIGWSRGEWMTVNRAGLGRGK